MKWADAWDKNAYKTMDRVTPYQEAYDATREIMGWNTESFEDNRWGDAVELMNDWKFPVRFSGKPKKYPVCVTPWTFLLERDIPFMEEKEAFAQHIINVEECIHLENRSQIHNLSLMLSTVGKPLNFAKILGNKQSYG